MNARSVLEDPDYPELKSLILEITGLHYYNDKDEDLAARVARRLAARHVKSCGEYVALLRSEMGAEEQDCLVGELTIGETYFFRQEEHFELLRRTVIPGLLERNAESRRLRIWSAGCANGAEPYSIGILLQLEFANALEEWDVSILGSDIDPHTLRQARSGMFGTWSMRQMSADLKARCFEPHGRMWRLKPEFRKRVTFERHNLISADLYPGRLEPFDIILCRNVLIYFSTDTIRMVASRLRDSLADHGWLLVGHAEPNAANFPGFTPVLEGAASGYRKAQEDAEPLPPRTWTPPPEPPVIHSPRRPKPRSHKPAPEPNLSPARAQAPPSTLEEVRELADSGAFEKAEEVTRRILEANPLHAGAHYTLGLILEHHTCGGEAEAAFRRAIYLDRGLAMAHYHLGACLERLQRAREARKSYENALTLLRGKPGGDAVPHGGGMTMGELEELLKLHLQALSAR